MLANSLVPYQDLNRFFFAEIVDQLPEGLQDFIVDPQFLRVETTEDRISSLENLFNENLVWPWMLGDIFAVDEETKLAIGKSFLLLGISCLLLDQQVDGQMLHVAPGVLIQQHLLIKATQILHRDLNLSEVLRADYSASLLSFVDALAIELKYIRKHTAPFEYEVMQQVCTKKAAPLRFVVSIMASYSKNTAAAAVVNSVLDNLSLAGQLGDDAQDWQEDFLANRYTWPIVQAMRISERPLAAKATDNIQYLQKILENEGILAEMMDLATTLLLNAQYELKKAGLSASMLFTIIEKRMATIGSLRRHYHAIHFLEKLINKFEKAR